MIVLIPHVIRRPEITPENLRAIAVGNFATVKVNYAPKPVEPAAAALPGSAGTTAPPATAPPATAPPATAPPATAPPATAPLTILRPYRTIQCAPGRSSNAFPPVAGGTLRTSPAQPSFSPPPPATTSTATSWSSTAAGSTADCAALDFGYNSFRSRRT